MNKTLSEIRQEKAGTLERNRAIKFRWEHNPNKWGIQTEMARQYKISRQAINIICHRKDLQNTPQKPQNRRGGVFWGKLIVWVRRLINETPKGKEQV